MSGRRVGGPDRLGGIEDHDVLEHATLESAGILEGEVVVADLRGSQVDAEAELVLERLMCAVQAALQPLEAVGGGDSLLFHVVERGAILRLAAAAGKGEVVVLRRGGAQ